MLEIQDKNEIPFSRNACENICPDCGAALCPEEGCMKCYLCGFSKC